MFPLVKHKCFCYTVSKGMGRFKRIRTMVLSTLLASGGFFAIVAGSAYAITVISESYQSTAELPVGAVVSLVKDSRTDVEPAFTANVDNLLGVVVNPDSSLITVSTGNAQQVQIATSGTLPVLVSDINGEVKRGDHITSSPLKGVGMLANGNVRVVGIAQGDMTGKHEEIIKDVDGNDQKVTIGEVPVLINVAYFFKEPEKSIIPVALQNVANSLAGREVKPLPIIISAVIFIVTLIVVVSIIFSMIRHSIISVGRNPMSQSAVYRDVIHLSALVVGILAVAIVAIYMVLTRM